VEASPDVIVSLSLDGVIETFNAAAERHSGWTAAEVVGQPVTLMVPPENAGSIPGVLAKVAGGRTIERLRVDLVDKRGEREEASLSAAPIPGPDGAVAGIACLIRATSDG
jgi:PAS domain S-box-containing protein